MSFNPGQVAKLMTQLGIEGFDPSKMSAVMNILKEQGESVETDSEELKAYLPDIKNVRDFYIPSNMRKLSIPDPKVFRRLLGIKE